MKKFILIVIIAVVVIAVGGYFYLKTRKLADFEPAIKTKLQNLVIKATDSLYRLEFDTIDADITASKVTVVNARLIPDTAVAARLDAQGRRPENIFSIQLDTLAVAGIDLKDFTRDKKIDLDTLYINRPKLEVFHKKPPQSPKDTTTIEGLYDKLAKQLNRLAIKKLYIQNAHVIHHNYTANKPDKKLNLDNINIALGDVLMDSTTAHDTTRFLFAKDAVITLLKLNLPTADSLYFIKLDSIAVDAVKHNATMAKFAFKCRFDKEGFVKQVSHQKDLYNITIRNISLQNINWGHVLTGEDITADNIKAFGGNVHIYCDRRLAKPPSKLGKYPHQLLMKDSMPINIKNFVLDDFTVTYDEFNPNSGKTGKIVFNDVNGTVSNITNDKQLIARNNIMKASGGAMFMNQSPVKATFRFNLARAKDGIFTTDASMGSMDATQLKDLCGALGRFSIDKGHINGLTTHIEGNNYGATGSVTFLYDDLKISLLKKQEGEDSTKLKKRGLLSFIANTFVIKNSNPIRNRDVRTESCQFTRDITKSFFNLVWKTVEDGVKKTAGYKK